MFIELRSRCPVRLWWHDVLECVVTQARIITLKTEYQLLGWVVVNGLVDSDDVLVELVNPLVDGIPPWSHTFDSFATVEQAKHDVLTRVRARVCSNASYRRWASDGRRASGWMPRLTNMQPKRITVTETW